MPLDELTQHSYGRNSRCSATVCVGPTRRNTPLLWLAQKVAGQTRKSTKHILRGMRDRSAIINRYDRVTGDAIVKAAETLVLNFQNLSVNDLQQTMEDFVDAHVLMPNYKRRTNAANARTSRHARNRIFDTMIKIVRTHRDGL